MALEAYIAAAGALAATTGAVVAFLQLHRMPRTRDKRILVVQESPATGRRRGVRHNVPPREEFIGRENERIRVFEGLESSYPVVSIEGLGGMGKTALAREAAWLCLADATGDAASTSRLFDAIVWAEDTEGSLTLNKLLDLVADVLDYPYVPSMPLEQKRGEVFRHLQNTRTLIVVDNLETLTDQTVIDFLARIPEPPSRVLVTSREQQLRAAWAVGLGKLDKEDGLALIRKEGRRLGLTVLTDGDSASLSTLYDATGGNPLAIRLAVGQMKAAGASLGDILRDLVEADQDDVFTEIFDRNWNILLRTDEYARRVLMTMSLFPGAAPRDALEVGSDVHHAFLRSAIGRLVELSLVDAVNPGSDNKPRFQLHTLTRAFARRKLIEMPDVEIELKERLADYYLVLATRYSDTFSDADGVRHLEAEHDNVLAFAACSYELAERSNLPRDWRRVLRYADATASYLWGRGLWSDRINVCERAAEAAHRLGDNAGLARQWALAGRVHLWRGKVDRAKECLVKSEFSSSSAGDEDRAFTKRLRAQIASAEGNVAIAEALLTEILDVAPVTAEDNGRAATLLELGLVAERRGNFQVARLRYEEALRLDEQLGTTEGQAVSLSHLGEIALELGDHENARDAFKRGLELAKHVRRLSAIGRCEVGLARIYAVDGEMTQARLLAEQAEETFSRLGMSQMVDKARAIAPARPIGE